MASVSRLLFVSVCLVGVVDGLFKLDFAPLLLLLLLLLAAMLVEELLLLLLFVDLSFLEVAVSPSPPFSLVAALSAVDGAAVEFVVADGGMSDSSSDRAPREIKNKSGTK